MNLPLHFDTVWISTDAQFAAFDAAVRNASWLTKAIGRYPIRPGAAYISMRFPPWKIPIVFVANGALSIESNATTFASTPVRKVFGMRYHNVQTDFAFALSGADIRAVEAYEIKSPFLSHFDMSWTRVRTARSAPLDDFLLTVGTFNALHTGQARKRAADLRTALHNLQQNAC